MLKNDFNIPQHSRDDTYMYTFRTHNMYAGDSIIARYIYIQTAGVLIKSNLFVCCSHFFLAGTNGIIRSSIAHNLRII